MNTSYQSRNLPIGHTVVDNFSPSNRSRLIRHGKTGKWAYLRNPMGGLRRVTYSQLEVMVYGV